MTKVKVVMNSRGARRLLGSLAVQKNLDERAERIAQAAGDGFIVRKRHRRRERYAVQVRADSRDARTSQAAFNTLARAIDAGR